MHVQPKLQANDRKATLSSALIAAVYGGRTADLVSTTSTILIAPATQVLTPLRLRALIYFHLVTTASCLFVSCSWKSCTLIITHKNADK